MIRHVVMFRLLDQAEGAGKDENAIKIKEFLETLPAKIPGIIDFEVGINIGKSDRAFDMCLVSTFESMETLHIYLKHEEHLKAVDFVNKRRTDSKSVDYLV